VRIHNAKALALLQIGFTFLLSLLSFSWVEPVRLVPSWRLWVAVVFTGLFATALAFLVQTWAQRYLSATRTGLILTMEPVFAAITAYLVIGERLQGYAALGAFLILAAVVIVELRLFTPRNRQSSGPTIS
jgi:drug/metabolite transporter (DMT)-like permease